MTDKPEVFYADPVDEDGNVTATASLRVTSSTWGPLDAVKIPHDEIVLDENSFHVRLGEDD